MITRTDLTERLPNPVLEGPMGLVALYDEIVFLNEAVCPKNMKELEFVKLLSDSDDIWDYFERLNIEKIRKQIEIAWKQIEFPYKKT